MKAIYKYTLLTRDGTTELPDGELLHVGFDPLGKLCVWAVVDPDNSVMSRRIHVVGTGHVYDDSFFENSMFLETVNDGPFMWHVFEEIISTE